MRAIHHAIEVVKQSEEMVIVFSVTLQVVNFIKEKEYTSLRIKDLLSLENYKDNSKDNHLLYHIMRKVVEAKPEFKGIPDQVEQALAEMGRTKMVELQKGLKTMEVTCRLLFFSLAILICRKLELPGTRCKR